MISHKWIPAILLVFAMSALLLLYPSDRQQKIDWANISQPPAIPHALNDTSGRVSAPSRPRKFVSKPETRAMPLGEMEAKAQLLGDRIKSSIDSAIAKTTVVNKQYQELEAKLLEMDYNSSPTSPSELVTDTQKFVRHVLFHYQETPLSINNSNDAAAFVEALKVSTTSTLPTSLVNDKKNCTGEVCTFRYDTSFDNKPVFGDSIVLTTVRNKPSKLSGHLLSPTLKNYATTSEIDTNNPALFQTALSSIQTEILPDDFSVAAGYVRDEQYLYPAYLVTLFSGSMPLAEVVIDSYSGAVVSKQSLFREGLSASGVDLFGNTQSFNVQSSGNEYALEDDTIPAGFSTKIFTAGLLSWDEYLETYLSPNLQAPLVQSSSRNQGWSPDAVSVISTLYTLADYFENEHQYLVGDGYSQGYEITVDIDMFNARAGGAKMFFGKTNGFNSARATDVVGHELTHSIIGATSKLYYYNQSGALNESFADFFGEIAEGKLTWKLGEDAFLESAGFFRSMSNPALGDQPSHMRNYVYTLEDNGGVHKNSGIPNRFLYLLAGGLNDEGWGDALGIEATADLAFQTLLGMTSYASFSDFYTSFEHLTESLYGSSSNELESVLLAARQVGFVSDSVLSTAIGSSLQPSDFNAMTYLRYDEVGNDYDVYLQRFANQARSYFEEDEIQIGEGATFAQPVTLMFEYGDRISFYKKSNGDIYLNGHQNGEDFGQVLLSAEDLGDLSVNSIAVSSDVKYLAIVFSGENYIWLYNLETDDVRSVGVTSPSYTEGFEGVPASYVDSIRFDPSGRKLALDFQICNSDLEGSCFWSIAFVDAETATISYPFPSQPSKYEIGYPAFGNVDTNKITLDIVNTETDTSAVFIYDILTHELDGISGVQFEGVEGTYYGNPSFTADDSALVFTVSRSDTEKYVYTIPIEDYKRAGDAENLNPRPSRLARSESIVTGDQIPELSADNDILEFETYDSQMKELCLINDGKFDIAIRSVQFPNNFYSPQVPPIVTQRSQSCFSIAFEARDLNPQTLETLMTINHDGANSPLLISLAAEVTIDPSIDSDGDGINDIEDDDRDGDGYLNVGDIFPDDSREWYDSDSDGIGDNIDETYNPAETREFLLVNRMDACDAPFNTSLMQWEIDGILSSKLNAGTAMRTRLPTGEHVFRAYRDSTLVGTYIANINSNTNYNGWGCAWDQTSYAEILDTYLIVDDSDGDFIAGADDAFPSDRSESVDSDNDGIGNNSDADDDGDGFSDSDELTDGTDPLDKNDYPSSKGLPPFFLKIFKSKTE